MKLVKSIFIKLHKILKSSWSRYPEAIIASMVVGILSIFQIHVEHNSALADLYYKASISIMTAIPMYLCIVAFQERLKFKNNLRFFASAIVLLLTYLIYTSIPEHMNTIYYFRLFVVNVSMYLAFTLIPMYPKKEDYSIHVLLILNRILISFLFSFVMLLGVFAILFASDVLLGISTTYKIYLDVFVLIFTLFFPAYFLSGIPRNSEETLNYKFSNSFNILFNFIVIPLIVIYTIILYLYFISVISKQRLPQNIIVHLVLWYSVISIVVMFFTRSNRESHPISIFYHRFMPIIMALPIGMMSYSLYIRIVNYGFTTSRYFVMALCTWVVGTVVYMIFKKDRRYQMVVVAAIIIMLASMYGPFNAFEVSYKSQLSRFEKTLLKNDMLKDDKIVPRSDLDLGDMKEIVSIFDYLYWNKGSRTLPYGISSEVEGKYSENMIIVFGFNASSVNRIQNEMAENENIQFYNYSPEPYTKDIDISKYTNAFSFRYVNYAHNRNANLKNRYNVEIADENVNLYLTSGKEKIYIPMGKLFEINDSDNNLNSEVRRITTVKGENNQLEFEYKGEKMMILLFEFDVTIRSDERVIHNISGILFRE